MNSETLKWWWAAAGFAVTVTLLSPVLGQPAEEEEEEEGPEVVLVTPAERLAAPNPSAAREALMADISDEEISAATERANRIERARRVSGAVDFYFGIAR